ncbi:MAG: Fe-S cluster assembly protein SufD [Pirellulaceae bacterium]|jgi:Fe-S cluster assembly protein SufD|nr:Fe-S cluster assembly protein SufD [Pirellulaceae bacterium]
MREMTTQQCTFDQAGFEALLARRGEPEWAVEQRRVAWARFCEQEWPARHDEEWIRTDTRLFKLDRYAIPEGGDSSLELPAALLREGVELAGQSTAVDSRHHVSGLLEEYRSRGVLFGGLEAMIAEHGERLRPHLTNRITAADADRFASLHSAFWSGGHLLYVPRGVVIEKPFHLHNVMTDGGVDLGRTLVILEDGAEATVIAENATIAADTDGLHCGAVELAVGKAAHLRYVQMQDWGSGVWHFARQRAVVDADASLQWTIAALGSRLAKVNQDVALIGPGANCQVNGVMFTEGKQHLSYHTLQHHEAPHCRSDFLYKSALQDKSRTVWRGMIKVDPAAQRTDGYQRNDNLLLSERARADSIPGLEIEADDVRCTHGSTSGRVDDELIFYTQCRGYTRREAVRIIVSGFFQQIFDRITIPSVRDALAGAIVRRVREYD